MSSYLTDFWSVWVVALTVVTFVLMTWVLFSNRKRTKLDEKTTGHVYDGIEEWDNPLPAWWFWMFVITIVWGVGYLIAYPGLGNFPGVLGWDSVERHDMKVAEAEEGYRALRDKYLALPIEEVYKDPKAQKMGMRIFGNNCSQCHGLDAAGTLGFPDLSDDDWIWGGSVEAIKQSIVKGRQAVMPPWEAVLGERGILEATAYVLSLNGRAADESRVDAGEAHYKTYCIACHGPDGKGNQMLGAPNLTNGIWLYGGKEAQIGHSLRIGRNGQMPAFEHTLSEDKIHLVTAYVYGLNKRN